MLINGIAISFECKFNWMNEASTFDFFFKWYPEEKLRVLMHRFIIYTDKFRLLNILNDF